MGGAERRTAMKIGILGCDEVREALRPRFGTYPGMIEGLLSRTGSSLRFTAYDVRVGELPDSTDECDAYVTTGSRHGVLDGLPWVEDLEDFVRRLDAERRKFIGICFGHQVMVRALGGEVGKSPVGWSVGITTNRVLNREPWMEPYRPDFNLVVSHQDQVIRPPEGCEVLARNDVSPYYMLRRGSHFLSVQGHPEFSPEYSRALMELRRDDIPPERLSRGLSSLAQPVHSPSFAHWMLQFLRQGGEQCRRSGAE